MELPSLPTGVADFIPFVNKNDQQSLTKTLEPFKAYEAKLREVFAQEPDHPILADPYVNTLPIFAGHEKDIKVRARDLSKETQEEAEQYLLPLSKDDRKAHGTPAIVESMKEFKTNFNLFSESSLVDMDWNNVVAAGSSVVTALLPVKAPYGESKRALREYYHEKLAPASDVDLFIYGLTEEQAIEKIKQIETRIRDSILHETTTIRTKNAITIASQYPTRHVQIVLRLYTSVSEILAGFDVDCSCVAYDGSQVWATPRAIAAYMSQINTIDLSRRSPSYENRLSKYSHRGFEVHWPGIERSRIDPTIFERSFSRVMGLARLLVLEKLPMPNDRDNYLAQRRAERGRPPLNWNARHRHQLYGNVKDQQPDDIAEWVEEDEVSSYHTFTVPYGPRYTAKKIEKLLFTKDLLLNAEWNKPKDREVHLHRHPAFFGSVKDVIHDCCGFCPEPTTDEEQVIAEEESKVYIKGDITFMKDDPGRQAIGSFHPITDDDWTEMAYVGNTERLCQAIVDEDLEHVQDWCEQEGADVNRRDHTGRTPLHLATMCSTPEIVQCVINNGARLVARLVDGFTSLHIAARHGGAAMVKLILEKSEQNAEEEEIKEEQRKQARKAEKTAEKGEASNKNAQSGNQEDSEDEEAEDEDDLMEDDDESTGSHTITEGSFVKVRGGNSPEGQTMPDDDEDEPDVFDVDVLAWDSPVSPLHLAIMGAHVDVIEVLVETFGADVLLPVKLINDYNRSPRAALLTLVLAFRLPLLEATKTTEKLLQLGASSAQADMNQVTAFHFAVAEEAVEVLEMLFRFDEPAAKRAINHLSVDGYFMNPSGSSPLLTAIRSGNTKVVDILLTRGAETTIDFETFMQSMRRRFDKQISQDPTYNMNIFKKSIDQPVMVAAQSDLPALVRKLLDGGADPNTLDKSSYEILERPNDSWRGAGKSLLDIVEARIKTLNAWTSEKTFEEPKELETDGSYLANLEKGTYKYWLAKTDLDQAKEVYDTLRRDYEKSVKEASKPDEGKLEKKQAVERLVKEYEELKVYIRSKEAKTFYELHPEMNAPKDERQGGGSHYFGHPPIKDTPYQTTFNFFVPDLTPIMKEGYFRLFQAAWDGDLPNIKELTLGPWGDPEVKPLQIAVKDGRNLSPFALAIYRGHLNVAKAILEIAIAQYEPDEAGKHRYELLTHDSDDDMDSGDDEINVHGELIDDEFTIEDIGAIGNSVKSKVSPRTLFSWDTQIWRFLGKGWRYFNQTFDQENNAGQGSLFRYAIYTEDVKLVQFLLDLGKELIERDRGSFDTSKIFSISAGDFDFAVSRGRTAILGEIIKKTGAGMPLQALAEKSGIKVQQKPRYYQGLSVHGVKREDWADAGRGVMTRPVESQRPPLLNAAFNGSLESTEFFLNEGPLRKYKEFAETNKDDARLQVVYQGEGGIHKALESWLGARMNLALHCAIMAKPSRPVRTDQVELVLRSLPGALNSTDVQGFTPFLLALSLRRMSACKVLIEAGANQLVRDSLGRNAMHHVLIPAQGSPIHDVLILNELLSLLDQKAIQPMLLERSGADPGATTPLSLWLHRGGHSRDVLETLLSYSEGKDLEIMNGAGDYPLHQVVNNPMSPLAQCIINYNPSLLYRENAIGMTPLEMVNNTHMRTQLSDPPNVSHRHHYHSKLEDRTASSFVKKSATEEPTPSVWEVCNKTALARPGKRKLVSLFDANEVAKRLALKQSHGNEQVNVNNGARRLQFRQANTNDGADGTDEVSEWLSTAANYPNPETEEPKKSKVAVASPPTSGEEE